jgi:hypothetical protein
MHQQQRRPQGSGNEWTMNAHDDPRATSAAHNQRNTRYFTKRRLQPDFLEKLPPQM